MAFEISEGQIFLHENKSENPKAPRMKGDFKILGVEYEIALWPAKSGKEGSYSGKVKVKGERQASEQPRQVEQEIIPPGASGGDDIPFSF